MAALDMIEEAGHVLRRLPVSAWLEFTVGCLPFALGLLYFWADMSRGAYAEERLAPLSVMLVGLFFWMKYWQSMFAQSLRAVIHGHPKRRPTLRRRWNILLLNAAIHSTALFLLPVALVLTIPFPHVYAFYHNITVLADGEEGSLRTNIARAWRAAGLWTGQNILLILSMKMFALLVFLNWMITLAQLPHLLKMLLGIETAFTRAGNWTTANSTYQVTVCVLTWLCISPFMRAIFALRCFYSEALQTGEDLRAELKFLRSSSLKQVAVTIAIGGCLFAQCSFTLNAAETTGNANRETQLDQALNDVLERPEFAWRMPREQQVVQNERELGWLGRAIRSMAEYLDDVEVWLRENVKSFIEWLDEPFKRDQRIPDPPSSSSGNWRENLRAFVYILLALAGIALAVLLVKLWRQRPATVAVAEPVMPDLNDEDIAADDLPEDEWLKLAHDLLNKGDSRLALRALYLACLAHLGERELVTISRAKSNREYQRELNRRARLLEDMRAAFHQNVGDFERVWYGLHDVTRGMFEQFEGNLRKIREC